MRAALILVSSVMVVGFVPRPASGAEALTDPQLTGCVVSVKKRVEVPAEDAGVLISLDVTEGESVREGYQLAQIDDTEPQLRKKLAEFERDAAVEDAKNDVRVRYARAQADVARATYAENKAANDAVRDTVTQETLRRLWLEITGANLSTEQSILDQKLAGITAEAKGASVESEEKNIERRRITAPIDGTVVALAKHKGEWVNPGDTVARIVNLEILRVEGFLNVAQYDPRDVRARPVTVEVELARGRRVQVQGTVTYVNPEVQTGGEYPVWAEVQNRKEEADGQWVLRPGLTVSMVIHVNRAMDVGKLPAESSGRSRTPVSNSTSSRR